VTDGRALAREFLEQQRQLGGDPVILPELPGAPRPPAATHPASRIPSPDLPPPGLSYDPPGGDLFSNDPVPQAGSLEAIAQLVASCTKCRLCEGRRHTVPGEGAADARLVVVGEGPGRVEDETGRPFVGPAGELLTKILGAIELPRERVFICTGRHELSGASTCSLNVQDGAVVEFRSQGCCRTATGLTTGPGGPQ